MNTEEKRSKQIINNYGQELTTNLNYFTLKESSGINDYLLFFNFPTTIARRKSFSN
jgi:hypothetical protein